MNTNSDSLIEKIKRLPQVPGVYLFKDANGHITYIGKAKNLRTRVSNYLQKNNFKADVILATSITIDYMATDTELEALILEAKLIQSHQPPHNVLLKTGQPFLYLMVTSTPLPKLVIARNKKKKGTYFGPFIEKGPARKVYEFLMNTFKLRLCGKKIENGCLYYHMDMCAGSCRPDFNEQAYRDRLELAKKSLKQGHKKFLEYLEAEVASCNTKLMFEKARELHGYLEAFQKVFHSLDVKPQVASELVRKDIWVLIDLENSKKALLVFTEQESTLRRRRVFYFPYVKSDQEFDQQLVEYFLGYYRIFPVSSTILTSWEFEPDQMTLFKAFLQKWHNLNTPITITKPFEGHYQRLIRLATVQAEQEIKRQAKLAPALKRLLKLPFEPRTVDCFDISHKQGMYMVGSCVRFKDGEPDKNMFRRFKIRTVEGQDDYASLREVVSRRYKDPEELPDLILIDGGKGQLNAVKDLHPYAEFISLAKREETVFSKRFMEGKVLDQKTHAAQLLIALRDYAHHFAITYHRKLEKKG